VNAQIRAQVSGYLLAQNYREGDLVKKGELLFRLISVLFKPRSTRPGASSRKPRLISAKRNWMSSVLTPLVKVNAISQQELDDAIQANLAAKAAVTSARPRSSRPN